MIRRLAEPLAFLGLATALHAGVWVGFGSDGATGAGMGGAAVLSLQAADPGVAAVVRQWQAPPEVSQETTALNAPDIGAIAARPVADTPRVIVAATPPLTQPRTEVAPPAALAQSAPQPDPVRPRPRSERRAAGPVEASATPAQPQQRAAGAGQRQVAGQAGASAATQPSPGQLRSLEAEWGAAILARIARQQRYPAGSHGAGTARVTLTVARDGRLQAVGLAASSGSSALDRAALDAVRRAGRFPAAPSDLAKAAYVFGVPMTFRQN